MKLSDILEAPKKGINQMKSLDPKPSAEEILRKIHDLVHTYLDKPEYLHERAEQALLRPQGECEANLAQLKESSVKGMPEGLPKFRFVFRRLVKLIDIQTQEDEPLYWSSQDNSWVRCVALSKTKSSYPTKRLIPCVQEKYPDSLILRIIQGHMDIPGVLTVFVEGPQSIGLVFTPDWKGPGLPFAEIPVVENPPWWPSREMTLQALKGE